jgi:cell division septation protein DedD
VPRPHTTVALSPSIAAARAAVAEASRATGTESPADAGASYARPRVAIANSPPPVVRQPAPPPPARPAPVVVARQDPPAAPAVAANGSWRVQLGAFSETGNADRLWSRLSGRAELAGTQRLMIPAGRVTKLQAGGFASRGAAEAACRSLKQAGQDCLVTQR